jgi:malate permease and related proteins
VLQLASFYKELMVLYFIAAAGYTAKHSGIFTKETDRALTQVLLYITLPSLILFSLDFPFSASLLKDFGILTFLSVFSLCAACLIAHYIGKKSGLSVERNGVLQGLIIFGNQGFLGYAICQALFSREGIMYAAVFNLFYLALIWTYGIYIIARNTQSFSWKMLFLNPGTIATSIGLIIFFLPFGWPEVINKFFQSLGSPTTPLSMLLIGSLIGDMDIRKIWEMLKDKYIWTALFLKLLLIPMLIIPFGIFKMKFVVLTVAVLIAAMPSGPTTSLYAKKYGGDVSYASVGVCISTLFLPITLPALYWLLNFIYK